MARISRIEIINAYNKAAEKLINEDEYSNAGKTMFILFAANLGLEVAMQVIDEDEYEAIIEPNNFAIKSSKICLNLIESIGNEEKEFTLSMCGVIICAYAHSILFPKGVMQ